LPPAFVLAEIPCYPIRGNGRTSELHWDYWTDHDRL